MTGNKQVEWIPSKDLHLMDINPRFIQDDKFQKLKTSILRDEDFMTLRPVLVNVTSEGNQIYGGSQRYKACLDLGWTKIPCMVEHNLPDAVIRDRMVKDNVHYGEWDDDKILDFLKEDVAFLELSALNSARLDFSYKDTSGDEDEEDNSVGSGGSSSGDSNQSASYGKHAFIVIFASESEKSDFNMALQNLPVVKDQRPEDFIANRLKQLYGQ